MPPKRCPSCGRFLSNQLVEQIQDEPVPCPRCEEPLTAAAVSGQASSDATAEEAPAPVRPPDLDPATVADPAEVLRGWDDGASDAEVAGWRADRRPLPLDTILVAAGAVGGAGVGASLPGRHRVAGAALGSLAGAVLAGALRRVWELRD